MANKQSLLGGVGGRRLCPWTKGKMPPKMRLGRVSLEREGRPVPCPQQRYHAGVAELDSCLKLAQTIIPQFERVGTLEGISSVCWWTRTGYSSQEESHGVSEETRAASREETLLVSRPCQSIIQKTTLSLSLSAAVGAQKMIGCETRGNQTLPSDDRV